MFDESDSLEEHWRMSSGCEAAAAASSRLQNMATETEKSSLEQADNLVVVMKVLFRFAFAKNGCIRDLDVQLTFWNVLSKLERDCVWKVCVCGWRDYMLELSASCLIISVCLFLWIYSEHCRCQAPNPFGFCWGEAERRWYWQTSLSLFPVNRVIKCPMWFTLQWSVA